MLNIKKTFIFFKALCIIKFIVIAVVIFSHSEQDLKIIFIQNWILYQGDNCDTVQAEILTSTFTFVYLDSTCRPVVIDPNEY